MYLLFLPSGGEFFLILIVFLLLFGADKIPEIAKTVTRGMRDLQNATDELKQEIKSNTSDIKAEIEAEKQQIDQEIAKIKTTASAQISEVEKTINDKP